jgi:hypothetical protein
VYLALYARRAWVIFDHPYNAEYALQMDGPFVVVELHRTTGSGPPVLCRRSWSYRIASVARQGAVSLDSR